MDARQLARLEQLFYEGMSLDTEARPAFCERHCADDPELHAKLLDMLLDESVTDPGADQNPRWNTLPTSRIGRYTIVRTIGRGGMGTVFEAIEPDPLSRRVALKILRIDLDSGGAIEQFQTECRLLARLEHPGIPRILDAGMIETGRPWFSMDLIHGTRLEQFLREEAPDVTERLRLFVEICATLEYAHHAGTLHLDVKRSNVLVSRDAHGVAQTHVIDFGIGVDASIRVAKPAVGSLATMSPEQAEPERGRVDARTDVYGLGVLLQEMLTERNAFDRRPRQDTDTDLGSILRGSARSPLTASRTATPVPTARLQALDRVIERATRVEPEQRHQSVAALRRDIEEIRHDLAARPRRTAARTLASLVTSAALILALITVWTRFDATPQTTVASHRETRSDPNLIGSLARLALSELGLQPVEDRTRLLEELQEALDANHRLPPAAAGAARFALARGFEAESRLLQAAEQLRTALRLWRETGTGSLQELAGATCALTALQPTINRTEIDSFSALRVMLNRIGLVDDRAARALAAHANTVDPDVARRSLLDVRTRLEAATWNAATAALIAQTLEHAGRHHDSAGVFPASETIDVEIEVRRRCFAPGHAESIHAVVRRLDARLLELPDADRDEALARAVAELESLTPDAAPRDERNWRDLAAESIRWVHALRETSGAVEAAERLMELYRRTADVLPPGAEPRRALLRRWLLAIPERAPDAARAFARRAYRAEVVDTRHPPRAFAQRRPALRSRGTSWIVTLETFDATRETPSAAVIAACDAACAADPGHRGVLASQLSSWADATDLAPSERVELARAAVRLARGIEGSTTVLRFAWIALARAALYADQPTQTVTAAREAISLDRSEHPTVDSMYPRSLLIEGLRGSGTTSVEEARALAQDVDAWLDPTHPFARYARGLAADLESDEGR